MKNIWILTLANLRKGKTQAIGTLALMLIAGLFLNIVVSMIIETFFASGHPQL